MADEASAREKPYIMNLFLVIAIGMIFLLQLFIHCALTIAKSLSLGLLIQVGRNIADGNCKLAVSEERKNDFNKLMEITLEQCSSFISLNGLYSNRDMCYSQFEKGYIVNSRWLNISLEIIESCIADI